MNPRDPQTSDVFDNFDRNENMREALLYESSVVKHPEFSGYRYDLENYSALWTQGLPMYAAWREYAAAYPVPAPTEFDPRSWFEILDQNGLGACQGFALRDAVAFCHYLMSGELPNLSPGWCYIASQDADGFAGRDTGSTLEAGTKVARQGIPLWDEFPYSHSYADQYRQYRTKKTSILADPSKLYAIDGGFPFSNEEDCKKFLDTRSGVIQIGIPWSLPSNKWEIMSYPGASGGGHSVTIPGFLRVQAWEPWGYGYLLKNSWNKSWGRDGWALLHPRVVKGMLSARWSSFIGRTNATQRDYAPVVVDI